MSLVKDWKYKGLRCRIHLNDYLGTFCGYVGLPRGHPGWGKCEDLEVEVHGSLTFAQRGGGKSEEEWPDKTLWWVGFDYAHVGDYFPNTPLHGKHWTVGTYGKHWSVIDVQKEVERLAEQLWQMYPKLKTQKTPSIGMVEI